MLIPPIVQRGDVVRLVSPASWPDPAWLRESIAVLESWGLHVEVGTHALTSTGSAPAATKTASPTSTMPSPIPRPMHREHPSWRGCVSHCGCSRLRRRAGEPETARRFQRHHVSAPCAVASLQARCDTRSAGWCDAQATVRQLRMSGEALTVRRRDEAVSAAVAVSGRASGPLVGGNLTAVATSVGTRLSGLDGAILFVEDQKDRGPGLRRWSTHATHPFWIAVWDRRKSRSGRSTGSEGSSIGLGRSSTCCAIAWEAWRADRCGIFAGHDLIRASSRPISDALWATATSMPTLARSASRCTTTTRSSTLIVQVGGSMLASMKASGAFRRDA